MIHIEGNYYLDSDRYQFIICEKKVSQKGKNAGQEYLDPVAFCGNLFQVKDYLMTQEIRDNLDLLNNMDECIRLSHAIDKSLTGVGKK